MGQSRHVIQFRILYVTNLKGTTHMINKFSKIFTLSIFCLLASTWGSAYGWNVGNSCGSQSDCGQSTGGGICANMMGSGRCQVGTTIANGGACTLGQNNFCASGYCAAAGGATTGVCQATALVDGQACSASGECVSGNCTVPAFTGALGVCAEKVPLTGACVITSQCQTGACVNKVCALPIGSACTTGAACQSTICTAGICTLLPTSSACTTGAACQSGLCSAAVNGVCVLPISSPCTTGAQCQSGICGTSGTCALPTGASCTAAAQCQSDLCMNGSCVTLGAPTKCTINANCETGNCLNGSCAPAVMGAAPVVAPVVAPAPVVGTIPQ